MPWLDVRTLRTETGLTDWTETLQLAIDGIIGDKSASQVAPSPDPALRYGTLYLPAGVYEISAPLLIRVTATVQMPQEIIHEGGTIDIVGDTPGTALHENGANHGSIIRATFNDRPAIIIQGGRGVRLRNLVLEGINDWVQYHDPLDMRTHIEVDPENPDANYLVAGPPPLRGMPRDRRYSPYAGLCIDPFSKTLPIEERYPGLADSYNHAPDRNTKSTNIVIEGCTIRGFVVGILIGASNINANAENIHICSSSIEATVTAIAVGHTQARHLVLSDVNIFAAKHAIDCVAYGLGSGNALSIFSGGIRGVRYLFNLNCAVGAAYAIQNLSADHCLGLGQFGGADDGLAFDGCSFRLGAIPDDLWTVSAHLLNNTQAIFSGCTFAVVQGGAPGTRSDFPLKIYNDGKLTFSSCTFHTRMERIDTALWVTEQSHQVVYQGCALVRGNQIEPFGMLHDGEPRWTPPGTFYRSPVGAAPRWVAGVYPRIFVDKGRLETASPGRATFTITLDPDQAFTNVFLQGDLLVLQSYPGAVNLGLSNNVDINPTSLVVGTLQQVNVLADRVILDIAFVPAVLAQISPLSTAELVITYLPKVHPATYGLLRTDSFEVTGLTSERWPLDSWRPGDRVWGAGLAPGTSLVAVLADRLVLSTKPTRAGLVRLFDADCRELRATLP